MEFDISCSYCGAELSADSSMHGTVLNCPSCGNLIKIKKPDNKKISKASQVKIGQSKNEKKDVHIFTFIGPLIIGISIIKFIVFARQRNVVMGQMSLCLILGGIALTVAGHYLGKTKNK